MRFPKLKLTCVNVVLKTIKCSSYKFHSVCSFDIEKCNNMTTRLKVFAALHIENVQIDGHTLTYV